MIITFPFLFIPTTEKVVPKSTPTAKKYDNTDVFEGKDELFSFVLLYTPYNLLVIRPRNPIAAKPAQMATTATISDIIHPVDIYGKQL